MANSLSTSASKAQYLSEATVSSFISQCLKMSRDSRSSVSVALTALSATRQIVTLVMDASASSITSSSSDSNSAVSGSSGAYSSESTLSAQRLIRDLTLFSRGLPGEWIKGQLQNMLTILSDHYFACLSNNTALLIPQIERKKHRYDIRNH